MVLLCIPLLCGEGESQSQPEVAVSEGKAWLRVCCDVCPSINPGRCRWQRFVHGDVGNIHTEYGVLRSLMLLLDAPICHGVSDLAWAVKPWFFNLVGLERRAVHEVLCGHPRRVLQTSTELQNTLGLVGRL